jgi:arabinose-5-phosphate isomerase
LWLTQGFDPECVPAIMCVMDSADPKRYCDDMKKILPGYPAEEILRSAGRTIKPKEPVLMRLAAALENGLAEPFVRAVETLGSISGRVIVTGVGKSGHVGAKIAATLASTGTPSQFVHPAEANHGDLGMITRDDAIIVLSWSGETAELKGILAYSRRFQIPLIAFTSGDQFDAWRGRPTSFWPCRANRRPARMVLRQPLRP